MATSLVAAIESAFEIKSTLIEGHNGIYEVKINDQVVYSNQSQCKEGSPGPEQIVDEIGRYIGVKPKLNNLLDVNPDQESAPACPLPGTESKSSAIEIPVINSGGSDCGCGPTPINLNNKTCC